MDNPHFQRSILSCLKNLDLAAIRLQADQVDESVAGLVVEGKDFIDTSELCFCSALVGNGTTRQISEKHHGVYKMRQLLRQLSLLIKCYYLPLLKQG